MSTLWCVSLHNSLPSNVGLNCEYNGALRREIFFYEPDLIRWVLAALFLENEIEGEWIFFFFWYKWEYVACFEYGEGHIARNVGGL